MEHDIISKIRNMRPGQRLCYYEGKSWWIDKSSDLAIFFRGLHRGGRYTFAQKLVGLDCNGEQIFQYYIWKLKRPLGE